MVESSIGDVGHLLLKIQEAFAATFGVEPQSVTLDTMPKDIPAWDSMGHVALMTSLEERLDVHFDIDEVMEMEGVQQIVGIAGTRLAAKRSVA